MVVVLRSAEYAVVLSHVPSATTMPATARNVTVLLYTIEKEDHVEIASLVKG